MLTRFALIAALIPALIAGPLDAAPPHRALKPVAAKPEPAPPPLRDTEMVAITTDLGVITLALDGKHAPISTANFLRYVDGKRYDGVTFYRSMHLAWGDQPNGLIQAGIRDPRLLFPPVAHEPTSQTGILHKAGAISLARLAPGTARADFSLLVSDITGLDADPASPDPEAQAGYAAFGHIVAGQEVVRKIWDRPNDPQAGEGFMKGQMLAAPVKILTIRRIAQP